MGWEQSLTLVRGQLGDVHIGPLLPASPRGAEFLARHESKNWSQRSADRICARAVGRWRKSTSLSFA